MFSQELKKKVFRFRLISMKLFLTAFFIFFSLLSSAVEHYENENCSDQYFALASDALISSHVDCLPAHSHENETKSKGCHESNCFGSAHFGHGFYCEPKNSQFEPKTFIHFTSLVFNSVNHHSLVYLDNLFRPPLA